MSNPAPKYAAFISYRHVEPDRAWAKRLHTLLETFRTPPALVKKGLPARLGRFFRDEEELSASSDLSAEISAALEQSQFLIVICSPQTPQSQWVNAEVARFRELGRHDRILALLIAGEPRDAFPPALCEIRRKIVAEDGPREQVDLVEPLAADVRPRHDVSAAELRTLAQLRLASAILGVPFDDLRQRDLQRRLASARRTIALTASLALAFILLSLLAWQQRQVALTQRATATELATKNLELAKDADAKRKTAEAATLEARLEAAKSSFVFGVSEHQAHRYLTAEPALLRAWALIGKEHPLEPSYRQVLWNALTFRGSRVDAAPIRAGGMVRTAIFSSDGERVLTASNSTAQLWNASTGEPIGKPMRHLPPSAGEITPELRTQVQKIWGAAVSDNLIQERNTSQAPSALFDPTGEVVVTADTDNTLRLWSGRTGVSLGEPIKTVENEIPRLLFTPDGARLLVIGGGKIRCFQMKTRRWEREVPFSEPAYRCELSPDGSRLLTMTLRKVAGTNKLDERLLLWDIETGKPLCEEILNSSFAAFTADSAKLIGITNDWQVFVRDTKTGQPIGESVALEGGAIDTLYLPNVALSPDGVRLVLPGKDWHTNHFTMWNWAANKPIAELLHDAAVNSVRFSDDGRLLVTTSRDKTARLWDGQSGKPIGEPLRHDAEVRLYGGFAGEVTDAGFSRDGRRVLARGYDFVRVWPSPASVVYSSLSRPDNVAYRALSPDGTRAVAIYQGAAMLRDVQTDTQVGKLLRVNASIQSVMFSDDSRWFAVTTDQNSLFTANAVTGVQLGPPIKGTSQLGGAQAFSRDGTLVAASMAPSLLGVWNTQTGKPATEPFSVGSFGIGRGFSKDLATFANSEKNTVKNWDLATGQLVGQPLSHDNMVQCLAFNADATAMVTGGADNYARVWNLKTSRQLTPPMRHQAVVMSVTFSPDGTKLVTCGNDKTLRVWEVATGAPVTPAIPLTKVATRAKFSPDGLRILAHSQGGPIRFWDAQTGTPLGTTLRHEPLQESSPCCFSRDGRSIVTLAAGEVRIWSAPSLPPTREDATRVFRLWTGSDLADAPP